MLIQMGVAPAMEQRPKVEPENRILPGQEITANEMAELIIRHRIGIGFLETRGVWHACLKEAVSASANCYFEASAATVFDAVAILRARLGNELYREMYADAIKTQHHANLKEA